MTATYSVAAPVVVEPREPVPPASGYRPHLDGLRAVAVYLVVLFHAGAERFPGGFIGVDVFFVLSGYLVTQLLLRDIAQRGSIRFGRFYARRYRRLLPAAFVTLVVTAAVFSAVASPAETLDAIGAFKASFLYSANWFFINQSANYFAADIATNPVLQFWSLAVEEQFYLVWPLALAGVFALTRRFALRQLVAIRVVVGAGALASLLWAVSIRTANPGRAYYGTDARAYQLLAGALIALAPVFVASAGRFRRSMHLAAAVSLGALLVLASQLTELDAIERGIAVTAATCVLIVAVEASERGGVKRFLSNSTMVYLGKISYGTYLWHWPVLLVAARAFHLSSLSTIGIAFLLATALASLSATLLELPVRESRWLDHHRRIVIASGLAISIVAALVLIPAIMDPGGSSSAAPVGKTTAGGVPVPANLDWRGAKQGLGGFPKCLGQPVDRCTIVKGTGRHLLLMGDSHAWMWIPTFTEIARRENLTLSVTVKGGCPWQRDLFAPEIQASGTAISPQDCRKQKDDAYERVIPELDPDVIVVTQYGYEDPAQGVQFLGPDLRPLKNGTPAFNQQLAKSTRASIAALRAGKRDLLVIEPIPRAPAAGPDPLTCLSKAKALDECRYVASAAPSPLELVYRSLAKLSPRIRSADFDRLVCPYLPICDPVVDGQIVKMDKHHLTVKYAVSLADPVDAYLKQVGLIPR